MRSTCSAVPALPTASSRSSVSGVATRVSARTFAIGEILHGSALNLHPDFQRLWRLHDRRLHGDHDFSLGHSRTSLAPSLQPAGRPSANRWRLTARGHG